jgi:N-acetylmuramoyl-L-alanine amidase
MKRIIWHWSAGGHKATALDKKHYHFIIEGDGTVVAGDKPAEANLSTKDGDYMAHTLGANTGAIGVSVAAMAGAVERPFNAGKAPITQAQVASLVTLTRKLAQKYSIPIARDTILSHAEVQPTLGIKQRGKWDIAWLPGMDKPGDPIAVGDILRAMVTLPPSHIVARPVTTKVAAPMPAHKQGWLAAMIKALFARFAFPKKGK